MAVYLIAVVHNEIYTRQEMSQAVGDILLPYLWQNRHRKPTGSTKNLKPISKYELCN
jgi:hypothetical protein